MAVVAFDRANSPNTPGGPKKVAMATVIYAAHTSQQLCDVLDFRNFKHLAVLPTVAMTGVTVWASPTTGVTTFIKVNDIGTTGSVAMSATTWNSLDPNKIGAYSYIQLQAGGTTGTITLMASD